MADFKSRRVSSFLEDVLESFTSMMVNPPEPRDYLSDYVADWIQKYPRPGVELCGGDYATFLEAFLIIIHEHELNPYILDINPGDEPLRIFTNEGVNTDRYWFNTAVLAWQKQGITGQ